ncbi:hypothetical protein GM921_01255 [Pedobacter sp. LMG 31464]|uniref:Uncharacterized protein n=1 Tax=Pedobacter planticolens TaxID=2679964 RepID=A0A923DY19_9SPHI|nr:hypothetical protein [Pedobacter planticolens]MBB2144099.1 hypothetical protein [Pedobacter planticolens]
MIAIVTSCIHPKQLSSNSRSFVPLKQRIEQTLYTLERLKATGFKQIILIDNSYEVDFNSIKLIHNDVKILHIQQYQFTNKGINELLMLLTILDEIPKDTPIFKISGRYFPNESFNFEFNAEYDFKLRTYNFFKRRGTISTRGYFVKNKEIYEDFLLKTLNEAFIYQSRFVGWRSSILQLKNIFFPIFSKKLNTSIEFAAVRVLKNSNYKLELIDTIGIEGQIAGFENLTAINE